MIACPKEVRTAVPADRFALLDLIRAMHLETGLAPFDEEPVRAIIWRGVQQDESLVGIIETRDKGGQLRIEGSIGLFVDPWWYSKSKRVYDLWNFVAEPYRRSTHAKKLLEFAKFAASELNRPLIMALPDTDKTSAKLRLYERQLPKGGAFFVYNAACDIGRVFVEAPPDAPPVAPGAATP